jgi:hypothetical protein
MFVKIKYILQTDINQGQSDDAGIKTESYIINQPCWKFNINFSHIGKPGCKHQLKQNKKI